MNAEVGAEMPRYQSHKKVWALKISSIEFHTPVNATGPITATITPADDGFAPFPVDAEYVAKHKPKPDGYYVIYEDGYKSWSPGSAFESGYTRI